MSLTKLSMSALDIAKLLNCEERTHKILDLWDGGMSIAQKTFILHLLMTDLRLKFADFAEEKNIADTDLPEMHHRLNEAWDSMSHMLNEVINIAIERQQ